MESESEPLLQNTTVETDSQNALFAMRKIVKVHIAKIRRCVNFQFHGHCNMLGIAQYFESSTSTHLKHFEIQLDLVKNWLK